MARITMLAIVAAAVAIGAGGCSSSMKVTSHHDEAADFASFRTFGWADAAAPAGVKPETDAVIREEIGAALRSRGLSPVAAGGRPDLLVQYDVAVQNEQQATSWPSLGSRYSRPQQWDQGTYQYRRGALGVDLIASATGRAVWHGAAQAELHGESAVRRQVNEAVTRMFAKYPG